MVADASFGPPSFWPRARRALPVGSSPPQVANVLKRVGGVTSARQPWPARPKSIDDGQMRQHFNGLVGGHSTVISIGSWKVSGVDHFVTERP